MEIGPYEEAVVSRLLDSYRALCFEPLMTEIMQPLVTNRVVMNFTSTIVSILVTNISSKRVTRPHAKS